MKRIFLICMMLFTFNVYAKCDSNELNRLKELAKKVEFTYQYTGDKNNQYFDITASNLHEDLKVLIIKDYYMDDYQEFKYNSKKTFKLSKFENDSKVKITIKAFVPNECSGETVYTKTIDLPFYNSYQNSNECLQYPDFKYCQEFLDNSISKTTFDSALHDYIEDKENISSEDPVEEKKDYGFIIFLVVIILLVIMGTFGIMLVIKNKKANEL